MKLYRYCLLQFKKNKLRRFFTILLTTFSLAFLGISVFLSQTNERDVTYQLLTSYSDKLINFSISNDKLSKEQVEKIAEALPGRKYFVSTHTITPALTGVYEGEEVQSRFTMYKDIPFNPDGSVGYASEEEMLSREHVDYIGYNSSSILCFLDNKPEDFGLTTIGSLPVEMNEIMISECFARSFIECGYGNPSLGITKEISSYEDCIGIQIQNQNGGIYTVTGVYFGGCDSSSLTYDSTDIFMGYKIGSEIGSEIANPFHYAEANGIDYYTHGIIVCEQLFESIHLSSTFDEEDTFCRLVWMNFESDDFDIYYDLSYHPPFTPKYNEFAIDVLTIETRDLAISGGRIFQAIGLGACLLFGVFAALLTSSLVSTSLYSQKRQMGVLRSLGAGKRDIYSVYLLETALTGAASAILSVLIDIPLSYRLNQYLSVFGGVKYFHYTAWVVFVPLLVGVGFSVLVAYLVARKFLKQEPIDLLNNRKKRKKEKKK